MLAGASMFTGFMLKRANEKMRDLNDAGRSRSGIETAAGGPLLDRKGFTSRDLKVLQEAHQRGIADRGWGRGQFVTNEFSEYLAIWNDASADHDHERPTLSIVRFDNTGTYALLVDGKIVAAGKTLGTILPALAVAGSTTDQS